MNGAAPAAPGLGRPLDWKHGVRLAIAVVAAFAISAACGLPENFWAVMSALIVVRPTTGSTLGAGWDRVRGTMVGTAFGLAGVWLHHTVIASPVVTLAIVAAIAFGSAVVPALRSAPIAALIVLTSSSIPGHWALDVAGLRAIEITIGVACGLVVSLFAFAAHACASFDAACIAWLRFAADATHVALVRDDVESADAREDRRDAARAALRELAVLAAAADREQRLLGLLRRGSDHPPPLRAAQARLMSRLSTDLIALQRVIANGPPAVGLAERGVVAGALKAAIHSAADLVARTGRLKLGGLRALAADDAAVTRIAPSVRLVLEDLVQLRRLIAPDEERRPRPGGT